MIAVGASIAVYTQSTPGWTFLGLGVFVLTLFASILISVFVNFQMVLPILYSLPRSIYHYLKGEVRFAAIPAQLVAPVIWFVALFTLGFLLQVLAPSVMRFHFTNLAVNLGHIIAFIVVLLSVVTPSGRRDLRADCEEKTCAVYAKHLSGKGDQIEAIARIAGNTYEQTKPGAADAPAPLNFDHQDSRFRYMVFCLSAVETACAGEMGNLDAVVDECLSFLLTFSTTETASEFFGSPVNPQNAAKNGSTYLKGFRDDWSKYAALQNQGDYAAAIDLICSMIHTTESDEPANQSDEQRLGPLALEIVGWLPTMRRAFRELVNP